MSKKSKPMRQSNSIRAFFCDEGHLHVVIVDRKERPVAQGQLALQHGGDLVLALFDQLEAFMPDEVEDEKVTVH